MRLADDRGVDAVQIRGGARVKLYRDATSYYEPGGGELLWDWMANANSSRALFGQRVMSDSFSFFDLADGAISDAYFLRLGEEAELPQPTVLNAQQAVEPADLADFTAQFGAEPGPFHQLAATEMAVQVQAAEDGWVHFVTEPMAEETGLLAVGLRLPMPNAPTGMPVEIATMDPHNPAHRVMSAECVAEGPGELLIGHVEALGVQSLGRRDVADGGLGRLGLAVDALDSREITEVVEFLLAPRRGPKDGRERPAGGGGEI